MSKSFSLPRDRPVIHTRKDCINLDMTLVSAERTSLSRISGCLALAVVTRSGDMIVLGGSKILFAFIRNTEGS
jgi:hypothetical protein